MAFYLKLEIKSSLKIPSVPGKFDFFLMISKSKYLGERQISSEAVFLEVGEQLVNHRVLGILLY